MRRRELGESYMIEDDGGAHAGHTATIDKVDEGTGFSIAHAVCSCGGDWGFPMQPLPDIRSGVRFRFIGLHGQSTDEVERTMTIIGVTVLGDLTYQLSLGPTDAERRFRETPLPVIERLIELGIWEPIP